MHELGLLSAVIAAVDRTTTDEIQSVTLRVGARSGALPDALLAAWPIANAGTTCETAALVIEEIPAAVWCPTCATEHEIDEYFALLCPVCETPTANLVRGREFEIAHLEVSTISQPIIKQPPSH